MANDLLKKLEEKINEAIETIELSRMEVTDLKAADLLDSEDEEVEDSEDEEELGSTFGTNADSFTEAPESAQHYA